MIYDAGRPRRQLNGRWHFSVDPYDTGLRSDWYKYTPADLQEKHLPWDYRPDGGDLVNLPSCWNMYRPEYFYYEGSAWYFPGQFSLPMILTSTSSYGLARLIIGNHYGGSNALLCRIDREITLQNLIQICVNNTRTLDRLPMRNTDWFNYGGIYRDVELCAFPKSLSKKHSALRLLPMGRFQITFAVAVSDETAQDNVRICIPELVWIRSLL